MKGELFNKTSHNCHFFRHVIDENFNYLNMFPEGKYKKEADRYNRRALRELGQEVNAVTEAAAEATGDIK